MNAISVWKLPTIVMVTDNGVAISTQPHEGRGIVDFDGIFREVSLAFVPEARVGDYVVVHVGVAISMIDPDEAERVFEYLEEVGIMETLGEELEDDDDLGGHP